MRICSYPPCNDTGKYNWSNHSCYCAIHYKLLTMIRNARSSGKLIPDRDYLEKLLYKISNSMICFVCKNKMVWYQSEGSRKNVISLQHNNDGTICLICCSCNSKHGNSKLGDTFYKLKKEEKYCPNCNKILNVDCFYKHKKRATGLQIICKKCSQNYQKNHLNKFREYNKKCRENKKNNK